MRPGSATHVTDFDQRSVALDITRRGKGSLTVRVPDDAALVPPGWCTAVAVDEEASRRAPGPCVTQNTEQRAKFTQCNDGESRLVRTS
ncbi:DUF1929 domain-containing protein [Streptomyces sp. TRM68367]|nr:DUF1929 domain-containing protein [Streptomyces sp. TRM68367]